MPATMNRGARPTENTLVWKNSAARLSEKVLKPNWQNWCNIRVVIEMVTADERVQTLDRYMVLPKIPTGRPVYRCLPR